MRVACFLVAAVAARLSSDKASPIKKVVNLLTDMQKSLQQEADEDETAYDKMACWCKNNDAEKTESISQAQDKISQLESTIEQKAAAASRLKGEIEELEKDLNSNQQALDKSMAMRKKDLGSFNEEEKDMMQSVQALRAAVVVLSRHHDSTESLIAMQAALHATLKRHHAFLAQQLPDDEMKVLEVFSDSADDQSDKGKLSLATQKSKSPEGSQILGILRQMLETFESNLSQGQKDEMGSQATFEELKSAKEREIDEGKKHLEVKREDLANAVQDGANAKEDLEDTNQALTEDQRFLIDLKQRCSKMDQEYSERQKTRQEEIASVGKALEMLTDDDARDLLSRSTAFVQRGSVVTSPARQQASKVLKAAARQLGSHELAVIATQVQLDAFTKVKKALDDMVAKLKQNQADEVKRRDFCVEELNTNEREAELKARDNDRGETTMNTIKADIDLLTDDMEHLQAEIKDSQVEIKRAGEDRERESKAFQDTIADQKATIALLQKTVVVIQDGFKQKKTSFLHLVQPAPPGFKAREGGASNGVVGLLIKIIGDAKVEMAEAIQAEKDAQGDYEAFVKDNNAAIKDKQNSFSDKKDVKAKKQTEFYEEKRNHAKGLVEAEDLSMSLGNLHKTCDFLLKNFDIRQEARAQEMEALRQAKALLSGAAQSAVQVTPEEG
mmetsp:Transcript_58531/g.128335  ORF Transcript_58531/g.128335 Transcript_58531/m.128335 type:complete len:671 (-) Transcript_58531:108-2120(-)|eukprot:CAMPEP_0204356938 /NCGR_PEP_ID=MMETSP0469-20131031/35319_1 /ASSEMBLY_ACC=CAM_ASM_000384 /TAXON_ID=2969 /ORGANISM="Oxyrrhis marina" /LENGTH=670 /DNA_ID=CAMNT_0051344489 /DNA_START=131 /DNA_END=2143 /DNA_ORIENTATION=-